MYKSLLVLKCARLLCRGVAAVFLMGATLGVFGAFLRVCGQILGWLKTGTWKPYPLWGMLLDMGIGLPRTDWVGIQKMIDWMMETAAMVWVVVMCMIGMVIGTVAIGMSDGAEAQIADLEKEKGKRSHG
jgi:hypothetical protein